MAGIEVPDLVRDTMTAALEEEYGRKEATLRAEYEHRMSDLKVRYPQVIARRLAEGLLRANGTRTVAEILSEAQSAPVFPSALEPGQGNGHGVATVTAPAPLAAPAATPAPVAAAAAPATAPAPAAGAAEEGLVIEAYIDSSRCTSCDECTNLNRKLFAYNEKKQAYIKDAKAGSFKDLVVAAEKCPVGIIHPGTPLNPKEKNLAKLLERAARFN